ncbi:MAG: hypothetical protein QG602_2467 [Verrucomicrobiota bacterium]|nr:hypothetical protein [Verrucomicrobiota bacterium]
MSDLINSPLGVAHTASGDEPTANPTTVRVQKESPILFSTPMVRALVAGTKTQTRRVVPHPNWLEGQPATGIVRPYRAEDGWWLDACWRGVQSRYGERGDILWVKETWRTLHQFDSLRPLDVPDGSELHYHADQERVSPTFSRFGKIRQSIFMRRWMSRLILRITDLRIERLREITAEDAAAEGIEAVTAPDGRPAWKNYLFETAHPRRDRPITDREHRVVGFADPRESYFSLWDSINGIGASNENPWVWVITFARDASQP